MIVIASHDDVELLENMLVRLSEINLNGHEVLIVDTNSDKLDYLEAFKHAKETYPQFHFIRKDYTCWDSGAYIHAYKHYYAEKYIFLQDSLYITNPNFFVEMDTMLDTYDVVPIFDFFFAYPGGDIEKEWVEKYLLDSDRTGYPRYGIFGPIFGVNRYILDKMPPIWFDVEPHNKLTGCRMERRWALMFHQIGASKKYLYDKLNYGHFWEQWPCTQRHIKKIWRYRLDKSEM